MMRNSEYAHGTFGSVVITWDAKLNEISSGFHTKALAILEGQEAAIDQAAETLENYAVMLEEAARGLRALEAHTLYPPAAMQEGAKQWAVSRNGGKSLRVVGEFTARRFVQMPGQQLSQVFTREHRDGEVPYAIGTDLVFGSEVTPASSGWTVWNG